MTDMIRARAPGLLPILRRVRSALYRLRNPESVFTGIYRDNAWGDENSVSGRGSSLEQTAVVRAVLPELLARFKVTSLLDAPCGDLHWMREVDLGGRAYIGADIVEGLIRKNERELGSATRTFCHCDLIQDELPAADLVFCRDCLVHLSYDQIIRALRNFKRTGARFLLTTTFVRRDANHDIGPGEWRPLNLQAAPFNFPAPLVLIDEKCTEHNGIYADKSLGLWRMDQLSI